MEQKGIKEMMELLAAVEVLGVAVKEVMKDGKIGLEDAGALVKLGSQFGVFAAAIEGIKEIPAEAKDIDAQEAIEIVGKLYAIAAKVQAA